MQSLRRLIGSIGAIIVLIACQLGSQLSTGRDVPRILLDPGHTPTQQGALGVRGIYEVVYNDSFTAKLAEMLRSAAFRVHLTRKPGASIGLNERAAIANQQRPDIFLAIHHDSTQLTYLEKTNVGYRTLKSIAGFSIFVSKRNPRFADAYRFAVQLGKSLIAAGRKPNLHHAEHITGENRELLDAQLGIYRFDDLVVLAKTEVPAVLLEVGVIVDADDEREIADDSRQDAIGQAIVKAMQNYTVR